MKQKNLNIQVSGCSSSLAGNFPPAYLRPEVELQRVELEGPVASSIAGSGNSNPNVDDWTPVDPGTGDNGDLGL